MFGRNAEQDGPIAEKKVTTDGDVEKDDRPNQTAIVNKENEDLFETTSEGEIVMETSYQYIELKNCTFSFDNDVEIYRIQKQFIKEKIDKDQTDLISRLDHRQDAISMARLVARSAQEKQAQRMLRVSDQRFRPIDVGQNILLPIPAVDRPKIGSRNLLGVVTGCNNRFYSIGTHGGHLPQMFTRNRIAACKNAFFSIESIPAKETTVRTAVGAASISGTQGHAHCMCLSGCTSNRCACKKKGLLCNSRYHHSRSCTNK